MIDNTDAENKARLLAVTAHHAVDFLFAVPNAALGTRLSHDALRIGVALRLAAPILTEHRCICGTAMADQYGHHGLVCRKAQVQHKRILPVMWVLKAVFSESSHPSYFVIFFIDSSISSVYKIIEHLRIPSGVGVFQAAMNNSDFNRRGNHFSRVMADVKRLRQLSSHTTIVVISDDLSFLAAFVKWSVKGRLLVWSTRLLVLTRLPIQLLQVHYTAFSKMNAMLLIINDNDDNTPSIGCNMYVHLPFSPRETQPLWVASWTPSRGLLLTSHLPLFPEKFAKFDPRPSLLVAAEGNPANKIILRANPMVPGGKEVAFRGPMTQLMMYLAKALNFSYRSVRPSDGVFGTKLDNGSWSGLMGMVLREEVDLAVGPFIISADRADVVDFTETVFIDYWRILGARGRPQVDPWGFLFPLEPLVWAAILVALLVLPLAVFLMSFYLSGNTSAQGNWLLVNFDFIRMLLQQDIMGPADWWWERVVLAVWGLVTVVLTQSYAGNLMALLAVRHIPQPYQSRQQVLDDPSVTIIWLKGSAIEDILHSAESGIYREMAMAEKTGRLIYSAHAEHAKLINTVVRRGDHVIIIINTSLKSHIAQDFTKTGGCSFYSSREEFLPTNFGMVAAKDNPIIPSLNRRITAVKEAGLYFQWVKADEPNSTVCYHAPNKITVKTALSISNVWGMIVILIMGNLVSFLAFCIELIFSCLHNTT
ncbi:probable glutamate receptor [Procambarus clarkii]|uniref:probable glutamate receptor n=1 Tax=Procambarus clarkii TaxID=6728 RepID=UPI0037448343